jgi:NADH:ubiquinone oxidoreductase subunit H
MKLYHPQFIEYEVSIDSKVVSLWLTKSSVSVVELNLELKPQENDIKISPNFIYVVIAPLIDRI